MLNKLKTLLFPHQEEAMAWIARYPGGLDLDERRAVVEWAIAEIDRLEEMVYVPGLWRCAKCDCRTMRAEIRVLDGAMRPLDKPQQCPNGCGPMWRVTERQAGNDLADRVGTLGAMVADLQKQLGSIERAREQAIKGQERYLESLERRLQLAQSMLWMVVHQSGGTFILPRRLAVEYDAKTAVLEQTEADDGSEIVFRALRKPDSVPDGEG